MMTTECLCAHAHGAHLSLMVVRCCLLLLSNHALVMLLLVRVLQSVRAADDGWSEKTKSE
jgi:hypothetical protein